MDKFMYHIPTKVFFGKGQIAQLADSIKACGDNVLLVYGGGSIKKIGLYDTIVAALQQSNIPFEEISGVDPNPRVTTVEAGVAICREHNINVVLAVGGGSVIDCGKAIAAGVTCEGSMWDMVTQKAPIRSILPIIAVLTLAATGSEMDTSAVISNMETCEKMGISAPAMRPVVAIMDPEYSYSVSKYQTAAGAADIISHVLEVYFNNHPDAYLQNRFAEAVLMTCVKYGHRAYNNPTDYEARANLMWASSWAINGLVTKGAPVGWSVHSMEHELSAYYDITHGAGLAVLMPHWLRHMLREDNVSKYVDYGVAVWGIDPKLPPMEIANKAIDATAAYFKAMDLPVTLKDVGIDEKNLEVMAKKAGAGLKSAFVPMNEQDVMEIFKKSL